MRYKQIIDDFELFQVGSKLKNSVSLRAASVSLCVKLKHRETEKHGGAQRDFSVCSGCFFLICQTRLTNLRLAIKKKLQNLFCPARNFLIHCGVIKDDINRMSVCLD